MIRFSIHSLFLLLILSCTVNPATATTTSFLQFKPDTLIPDQDAARQQPTPSKQGLQVAGTFTSSNLPILVITTTNNQAIVDDPKITAHLGIIYNGPGVINYITDSYNHYNGDIGIELRGNSTQNFPKKPYNFETRTSTGENLNVPLLGMPAENDWSLIASYIDHSFIRNPLAMHMSQLMGRWASRYRMVEVVLNGDYQGIYILMEKIKKDKNRLDIATLNPDEISGEDVTGGYIWEITGFEANMSESRNLKYPDFATAAPEQISYIGNYDDRFRNVMRSAGYANDTTGYGSWIDVGSFIDEMIVQEAMRNSDAYGWSGYYHKNKNAKIEAGPVWDFDQSAGNSNYPDDGVVTGWMFSHPGTSNTPFYWPKLFKDPKYAYRLRLRWEQLRAGPYQTNKLLAFVDSIATVLNAAQTREFTRWPVLGVYIWRETSGYQSRNTYAKELDYLKGFLVQRWNWMDQELAKVPAVILTGINSNETDASLDVQPAYPNPARDYIVFNTGGGGNALIQLFNYQGSLVQQSDAIDRTSGTFMLRFNRNISPGMYLYKIIKDGKVWNAGRFVKTN